MKSIAVRKKRGDAEVESAERARCRQARTTLPDGVSARRTRARKERVAQLAWEQELTVEMIQARAETVTAVLENILHSQPILPLLLR